MFLTDVSGPRDFQAVRQKTLTLAQVLQPALKSQGFQQVFSASWHENFKSAWPTSWPSTGMTSLRPPAWNTPKRSVEPSLLLRRKPSSWARNLRPHPSQNTQRDVNHQIPQSELMLSLWDPLSKLMPLVQLLFPPLCPNLAATLPRRQRNPEERLGLVQSKQASGPAPTYGQMKACQNGRGSSDHFFTLRTRALVTSKSRGWSAGKLKPSGCQLHSEEKKGQRSTPPSLCVLEWRDYLPPKEFQGIQDYQEMQHEEMVALTMALQR